MQVRSPVPRPHQRPRPQRAARFILLALFKRVIPAALFNRVANSALCVNLVALFNRVANSALCVNPAALVNRVIPAALLTRLEAGKWGQGGFDFFRRVDSYI